MPSVNLGTNPARAYWGAIRAGVSNHENTSQIWGRIRDASSALGLGSPGVSASQVGQLVGLATRMRAASDALNAAGSGAFDPETMLGTSLQAATRGIESETQMFMTTYQVEANRNGIVEQFYVNGPVMSTLPADIGDLTQDGLDLVGGSPTLGGVGDVQIIGMQINSV